MKTLRIFISSPSDVRDERQIAGRVIERLQGRYWSFVRLDDVFWETRVVRSTGHYQDELVNPGECEIVIGILWSKFGSPLPPKFRKSTGDRWGSGTEWELEMAFEAYEKDLARTGDRLAAKPDIIVYRRREPRIRHTKKDEESKAKEQEDKLNAYLESGYYHTEDLESGRPTNKRPIIKYALDEFESKFFGDLEELILRQIPTLNRGFVPPPISGCPFMDLRAFDFEHSDRFFGRNREIRQLQDRLKARAKIGKAFVLIYGASGYGKSSLMRAGIAPVVTRPGGALEGMDRWRRVLFQPTKSGDGSLIERLVRILMAEANVEEKEKGKRLKNWPLSGLPELSETRRMDRGGISGTKDREKGERWDMASLTRCLEDEDKRVFGIAGIVETLERLGVYLLLQVDQLEEVFSTVKTEDDERHAFFSTLADLSATGRVWVVATMRSEFFPAIAKESALHALVAQDDGGYILRPPDRQSLQEIIRFPAAAGRIDFERTVKPREVGGEKANHDQLDAQILSDAECSPDALPLLEFTLRRLYQQDIAPEETDREKGGEGEDADLSEGVDDKDSSGVGNPPTKKRVLTWDTYCAIGGLKGAIADTADRVYDGLSAPAKEAAGAIFAALVRVDPITGDVLRRPADLDGLRARSGATEFIDAFVRENLLVVDRQMNAKPQAHLVHEALVTHWPVLADWLKVEENRETLLAYQRFVEAFRLYQKGQGELLRDSRLAEAHALAANPFLDFDADERKFILKSDAAARRRLTMLRAVAGVFAVLALGAGFLAWYANRKAEGESAARARAVVQESLAKDAARLAEEQESLAKKAARLAEENERAMKEALGESQYRQGINDLNDGRLLSGVAHLAYCLEKTPQNDYARDRLVFELTYRDWGRLRTRYAIPPLPAEIVVPDSGEHYFGYAISDEGLPEPVFSIRAAESFPIRLTLSPEPAWTKLKSYEGLNHARSWEEPYRFSHEKSGEILTITTVSGESDDLNGRVTIESSQFKTNPLMLMWNGEPAKWRGVFAPSPDSRSLILIGKLETDYISEAAHSLEVAVVDLQTLVIRDSYELSYPYPVTIDGVFWARESPVVAIAVSGLDFSDSGGESHLEFLKVSPSSMSHSDEEDHKDIIHIRQTRLPEKIVAVDIDSSIVATRSNNQAELSLWEIQQTFDRSFAWEHLEKEDLSEANISERIITPHTGPRSRKTSDGEFGFVDPDGRIVEVRLNKSPTSPIQIQVSSSVTGAEDGIYVNWACLVARGDYLVVMREDAGGGRGWQIFDTKFGLPTFPILGDYRQSALEPIHLPNCDISDSITNIWEEHLDVAGRPSPPYDDRKPVSRARHRLVLAPFPSQIPDLVTLLTGSEVVSGERLNSDALERLRVKMNTHEVCPISDTMFASAEEWISWFLGRWL